MRTFHLPVGRPPRANRAGELAVGSEHLDAVVAGVGRRKHSGNRHGGRRRRGECDMARQLELAAAAALPAKLECERAVGVKGLDAVVVGVGHGYQAAPKRVGCGRGRVKLAVPGA